MQVGIVEGAVDVVVWEKFVAENDEGEEEEGGKREGGAKNSGVVVVCRDDVLLHDVPDDEAGTDDIAVE